MAQDLLATNIDGLFERMNLEETQQVLRKMRLEVERKREELRVTVGSRYRDLIDAADTITEMKKTSEEVRDHLLTVEDKLGSLKHRQLLGFQTDVHSTEKQRQMMGAKKDYRILAAQVKLLMELPEMIWKQLDTGNINNAAQLQQLGFHLHTGLSVESGMQQGNHPDVQKWFPVINRQKVSLTSFNEIISKESTNKLKAIQLTLENAGDSGCALVLLRGDSPMQILSEFLKLRMEALRSVTQSQSGVKQQLQSFIQFLVSSLATLHGLFVEGFQESNLPQGLLSEKLKSACQSSADPTVQLLGLTPGFIRQLPPIIVEFRPSLKKVWTPLPISTIRAECQTWFQSVCEIIPVEFKRLLDCVTQIKVVANLRDLAFTTLRDEPFANQWNDLTQRLLGSSVCIWGELFQPAFVDKIEAVIQTHLDGALDVTQQSALQNYNKFDLKAWLWTETVSDLPQSIASAPNSSGVYMKTRCYTPTVQQLCNQWDQKFTLLREDLAYYQDITSGSDTTIPFDRLEKRSQISTTLEDSCIQSAHKLVEFFKNKFDLTDNRVVFAMKLVTALIDLCPNFRKCVDSQKGGETKSWNSLVEFLRNSALDFFHFWKSTLLSSMKQNLDQQLLLNSVADTLRATPMWDEILIQEEGESGAAVQSQIRVPMNPSFPLQQSLFKVCQEVNLIGPHAISKKAQLSLMEDTGSFVLKCYETYITNYPSQLPQAVALQLLFDVRFIVALLIARDSKVLQEKARSLCESLEGRVDPFDLNVFNPHIQSHVKRAVQRLQFVFGPLLTADRHAILWAARLASPAGIKGPETPSVVSLVSSAPRFLPLPQLNQKPGVTDYLSSGNKSNEPSRKEDSTSSSQKKSNRNKAADASSSNAASSMARAGAAAFFGQFGAMGTGWGSSIFGGEK